MRAFFVNDLNTTTYNANVSGDDFTHYVKVLRGKVGQEVMLVNGMGLCAFGEVDLLEKKSLNVKINRFEKKERMVFSELVLCVPKKDYLCEILKMATEVGVFKIHLIVSDNTPWKFSYHERFNKIIKAAVLQSNNPFMPEVLLYKSVNNFLDKSETMTMAYLTEEDSNLSESKINSVLIGPEGGFSPREIEELKFSSKVVLKNLPNPIMKSVTASIFALGQIQT